ncbi:MAG: tryptophan 7-halogenase [Woeseiaceae bacterium]|nr:tryptophan 7-halogenase [Woeseiaceae bacterium]
MRTKRILVVGGGSSGWMAAAYLNAALNRGGQQVADIALVESPDVPRVGVGEATIPNINRLLAIIGIDEREFMIAVDGTFKQSIRYVNWLNNNDHYHHPFSRFDIRPIDHSASEWLQSDRSIPFMETVSAQPLICEMGLSPKRLDGQPFGTTLTYAFHMNALKFADFLTQHSIARGVTHYREHVVDVEMQENGYIAAVKTKIGQRLEADLFIDCTGFRARLIEKELGVGFVDCSQWLLCDRAVTLHVDYDHHYPGYVKPYTTATALSSGWVWEIPLQNTRSLGYVHSSHHISEENAERELRAFEGPHANALSSRVVNFKVGRREKVWVGNCIAIGLAGGFIEPLESTGLYLSDLACVLLAEHFPFTGDFEPMAFRVNRILANRFYEILDFINMHYCLTQRTDTQFWRDVRQPERTNDRLRAKLDYWKLKPPSPSDFQDQFFPGQPAGPMATGNWPGDQRAPIDTAGLWGHTSYEAILYGMDFLRNECDQRYGRDRPRTRLLQQILNTVEFAREQLPAHDRWLAHNLGMPSYRKTQ